MNISVAVDKFGKITVLPKNRSERTATSPVTGTNVVDPPASLSFSLPSTTRKLSPKSSVSFSEPTTIASDGHNNNESNNESQSNQNDLPPSTNANMSLIDKSSSETGKTVPITANVPGPLPVPHLLAVIDEQCLNIDNNNSNDNEKENNVNEGKCKSITPNQSRTDSMGSIPEKVQSNITATHSHLNFAANISNLLKSKRKSIAVSTMMRRDTLMNSNNNNQLTPRLVKESCDSSTSTTTSESYHLNDLPTTLPAKLATLNKPPVNVLFPTPTTSMFRNRKTRHSIDVRTLPSYLAKKRQSTFGQLLSGLYFSFSLSV